MRKLKYYFLIHIGKMQSLCLKREKIYFRIVLFYNSDKIRVNNEEHFSLNKITQASQHFRPLTFVLFSF